MPLSLYWRERLKGKLKFAGVFPSPTQTMRTYWKRVMSLADLTDQEKQKKERKRRESKGKGKNK